MAFREVDANLRHTLCLLASRRAGGEVRQSGALTIASAGVRFSMFNAALIRAPVSRSGGGLERILAEASDYFLERGLDWSFWVCDHWLDQRVRRRAASLFAGHGMQRATVYPGMIADGVRPPRRPLPPLDIRRVADARTRSAFCQIGCTCFHLPADWFTEVFDYDRLWDSELAGWVGYVDGEAVTAVATVTAEGSVGVYNVATLPGYQRRGYAEAVLRHALHEARRESGIARTILQSTAQGFPLYARMGYQTVTRFVIYVSR